MDKLIAIITMIFLFGMISFVTNLAAPMGIGTEKSVFQYPRFRALLGNFVTLLHMRDGITKRHLTTTGRV